MDTLIMEDYTDYNLDRILKYLPKKPYCSDDKTASKIRVKLHAIDYKYIQLNNPTAVAWLTFDIDTPFDGEWAWQKHYLPFPNYIAMTPETGRYHAGYAISPVFTGENARKHPLDYLAAIQRTYTEKLGADAGFANLIMKNPVHPSWDVMFFHDHEYSLKELHDACGDLKPKEKNKAKIEGYARNCTLFDELRMYAYGAVHSFDSLDFFNEHLLNKVESLNSAFTNPLSFNEIKAIAKSVARWTFKNRATIHAPKERILKLDTKQPLATRQAVGAIYTNQKRTEAVLSKMKTAHKVLLESGVKVTQKAIQAESGVGIATVKRYWKQIRN